MRVVWPEFFDMKNVTPMQIAEAILTAFDVAKIPQSAVRRGQAVRELLARLYQDGVRVAIAFDEVHRLNNAALSSLKNFLEMNSGGFQRFLGVVLFGQPIFEARLREYQFREIVERVVPLKMPNFSDSAADYLQHRLHLVGGDTNKLFDAEAVDLICSQATTPLSLGNIANEALKISMESFNNKQVIGSAIKTKMFFEKKQQAFSLRKAG
jgi:type II secretory pathway predicted ATPase ExeA